MKRELKGYLGPSDVEPGAYESHEERIERTPPISSEQGRAPESHEERIESRTMTAAIAIPTNIGIS